VNIYPPWPTVADVLRALPRAIGILAVALLFTLGACAGLCASWTA